MEIINNSVCRGVAGRRNNPKPVGIVIHNDAGSVNATAKHYVNALGAMSVSQLENGFAHYYIDRNTIARTEDTFNKAWHTANSDGNANYVGYEVCQSLGASDLDFLKNEDATLKQAAADLKEWGLPANRETVKLHREFVPTACPHRSWDLHGSDVNKVKDYFIREINKYMNGVEEVKEVIKIVEKIVVYQGSNARTNKGLDYRGHIRQQGWLGYVSSGLSGTVGIGRQLEAFEVFLNGQALDIEAHTAKIGWQKPAKIGGTTGKGLALEAFKINSTKIRYRAHVSKQGWQDWKTGNAIAGTTGKGLAIEAIEIELV